VIQLNSQHLRWTTQFRQILGLALRCLPIYFAVELAGKSIELGFEPVARRLSAEPDDSVWILASFVAISTLWATFSNALRLVLIRQFMTPRLPSPLSWLSKLNLLMIESIRALASVLYRVPLLVFPAIIQWTRLAPLPYLITVSPDYDLGKVDALNLTTSFASDNKWFTFWIASTPLLTIVPDLLFLNDVTDFATFFEKPIQHVVPIIMTSFIKFTIDGLILLTLRQKLTPTP
jgi:hypothetical protein